MREKFFCTTDIYPLPTQGSQQRIFDQPRDLLRSLSRKAFWNSEKNAIARVQSGRAGLPPVAQLPSAENSLAGIARSTTATNRTDQGGITVRITSVRRDLAADLAGCTWL